MKEDYPKSYTDPRSTPTGLHYWSTRTKQHKGQYLHWAPPWAWLRHLLGNISTCKLVLEVSVSHRDSAISHPRDQDYLSLGVVKGSEVELQQALAYMVANIRKWEREEEQRNGRQLVMIKKWSWTPTHVIHNSNCVHFPVSAEKRPSRLHTRLMYFN